MSYNQKPPGTGNSGMGGAGPPNGPNNPQVGKGLAGFQQQMPNFQGSQADFNALIQQQRIQSIFKQQQQHLIQQHLQHQMQQQQHQQQQQQYKDRGSSEPLALTRTPAAAELLNKTYQQHHQQHANGNPAAGNSALNQLQQLQVLQPNLMQQLQAFQLQMQQHQQQHQQQQHHAQTQQAPPPPPPSNPLQAMPQQQLLGQKAQQQNAAVAAAAALQLQQRYMSAAAAQATNINKAGTTPPPPLTATNQIKPPNLPPSTQITPVPSNSGAGAASTSSNKLSSANIATGASVSPAKQVAPSISLLPTKPPIAAPVLPIAAHQQSKFNANKSQTPTTGVAVTPTPAHMQKVTAGGDAFLNATSGGNALPTTSESAAKPNTNADNLSSAAKAAHKSVTPTKAAAPISASGYNVADTTAKTIAPLSASLNTPTTVTTQHHSSGSSTVSHSAKPAEKRDEASVQKISEAVASAKTSIVKSSVPDDKSLPSSVGSGKTDSSILPTKTNSIADRTNSGQEKQSNKVVLQPPSDSKAASSTSSTSASSNLREKPKDDNNTSVTAAANSPHNNNLPEKKEQPTEKIETSLKTDKVVEKTTNKDVHPKKEKQSDEKTPSVAADAVSSVASAEKLATKTPAEKIDKPPQSVPASKKPNENTKASEDVKKKVSENKNDVPEQTLEQTNEQSNADKDKEKENTQVDHAKPVANIKVDTKEASAKVESAIAVAQSDEPQGSTEASSTKKPQRQPKSNKSTSNAASTATAGVEKITAKAEKTESDAEKATSSRAVREEKRKKEKPTTETTTAAAAAASPAASTPKAAKPESHDANSDRKSQRHRLKTILYQSPLPELAFITKLSASEASNSPKPMTGEDKLIVFYKNEYMAVRNAEGTFYLCQTMQNVYRTSPKISIRWLSEDEKDNSVYIPDFYDHTDIECVLTTVELKRIDKGHLRLPNAEKVRIENILKKAIDVEKGLVPRPELTEENPDGLDLSLYKDESQIEKKNAASLQTPVSTTRNPRRSTAANAAKSTPKSASKAGVNKRKANSGTSGGSAAKKSKTQTKKRKSVVKRTTKRGNTSEDDIESSDDNASDTEYRPSQKKAAATSAATKSSPRVQRSPLAKARVASPIASTSRNKIATAAKAPASTPTPSRSERATKRKSSVVDLTTEIVASAAKKDTTISAISKSEKSKNKDAHSETSTVSSKKSTSDTTAATANSNTASNADSESTNGSSGSSRPTRSRK